MKTLLFYYTGTGNSLWTARSLAPGLGETTILPMSSGHAAGITDAAPDIIGMIFPVHVWGVPRRAVAFVDALPAAAARAYCFAVAVNAGQVAATLLQLGKLLQAKGASLSSGFSLVMPSNYIPWGGPGPKALQIKRFVRAQGKLSKIVDIVAAKQVRPVEKGPFWQNIFFSWINRKTYPHIPAMDKHFRVDDRCNGCGICRNVCPTDNIEMEGTGKPCWRGHCEQCLACIQWCPQEAIQFGKRTQRFERYHHPEVTIRDMMQQPSGDMEKTSAGS